jgi:hypothetical protein
MKTQIWLERTEDGWRCRACLESGEVLTNVYKPGGDHEEAASRGHALHEANIVISARQRFTDVEVLFKFIDAYRTTPLFVKSALRAVHVQDDQSLRIALARSVFGRDTVASMICRGILDLGLQTRNDLIRRLNDE